MWPVKKALSLTIVIFLCLYALSAIAKVYIDIDSPTFKKLPMAITDFKSPVLKPGQEDLSIWFADALAKSLEMTGYFHIISRKAFLEDPRSVGVAMGSFRFSDWSAIGAEYLVKGTYRYSGETLAADMHLFDIVREESLVVKTYTGRNDSRQGMIRQFSEEILLALTGDRGVFDTKIAFILKSGSVSDVFAVNFDGSGLTKMTDNRAITVSPRWSPDGRYLSFTSYRDGNPDLYVKDLDRGLSRKMADFEGLNLSGSWSPDGRKILMTLSKDGNEEIYAMEFVSKRLQRLTSSFSIDVSPTWSPDGTKIAFVSDRSGSPQVYVMDASGENVRRLTYEGNYNTSPAWSPKGKRIAYEGSTGGRYQIFTIDEDGNNLLQLTFDSSDNESPAWSPDGRFIAFSSRGSGRGRISIINADGSNPRVLYEGAPATSPAWSPHLR